MNVYQIITDRVIDALSRGIVPWQRPWKLGVGQPKNLVSKKSYRGVNTLLLGTTDFSSPWWMTYNQAKELGGQVKKGSKGTPVVFYTQAERKNNNGDVTTYPLLRYYTVFNIAQVELPEDKLPPADEVFEHEPLETCERIIENMPRRPEIMYGFDRAGYVPKEDMIMSPHKEHFYTTEKYYSTIFHELAHSTGHPTRLNRPDIMLPSFGSEEYAKEELIAEMAAASLCLKCGISNMLESSIDYLRSWAKALNDDPRLVVQASNDAQKAVDYILGELP